ncbi:hypothetical protein [Knoellia subterranea]|uniref:Uncharacterized protein n=1 Tax=Knoellia subterranea KCTC 19937 TaxID=1385521 RepID=A0A0A0JS82_9MICO|nr:hypothetical protein [Knoellia subterranea]KGN39539.1 hypothetical protein N803_00080 [Knoellia subterranea KCTC 19937]
MGPAELAALVAREADAGVAGALRAFDASGALEVEQVVGRIGSLPRSSTTPWEDVVWQAEVVMRPTGLVRDPEVEESDASVDVPAVISRLPVAALRGVGPRWTALLSDRGVRTIGELASVGPSTLASWSRERNGGYAVQLVARARSCAGAWPRVDRTDVRSIVEVSESDPGDVAGWPPGSRADAAALWASCLRLRAAIDDDVLERLAVSGA